MLHVERRLDVDARVEQLHHVLPALRVARPGGVRVRELVEQEQRRAAGERCVEVELAQVYAAQLDRARGQALEAVARASVSARPWVSSQPITTSVPPARAAPAASSIA